MVLCHAAGSGMAMKSDDLDACLGCYNCHTKLDGYLPNKEVVFDRAKRLTHAIWRKNGLI